MFAKALIRHFPQWSVAIFGLAYITGYLVDFFYYAFIGITDPGSELLKFHYIQIGLVFLLGYMLVVILLVFTVFGAGRMYRDFFADSRPWSNFLTSIMIIGYCFSIYVATIFAPPQYFRMNSNHFNEVLQLIGWVTGTYLFLAIVIDGFYKFLEIMIKENPNRGIYRLFNVFIASVVAEPGRKDTILARLHQVFEWMRSVIIGCIIFEVLYYDYVIFGELFEDLKEMFVNAGWTYIAFAMIFSLLLFRIIKRYEMSRTDFGRAAVSFLGFAILFMVYFLSLVSYAYTIFPYIATVKGGADYTGAPRARVVLRPAAKEGGSAKIDTDLVVLYTTSTAIFFADYKGPNNPCAWRARRETPNVIEIMRREILSIDVAMPPRKDLHPNCGVSTPIPNIVGQGGKISTLR